MHVHMPYRTMPGEGFACLLQWYNLKDAIAVYACDAGGQERRREESGYVKNRSFLT